VIAQAAPHLQWSLWLSVLWAGVILRALYAGLETGIYVMNKVRLELRAEHGYGPARLLRRMLDRPDNLLAVLLIGTNLTSYAATFAVSAMFVLAGHEHRAEWYTLAVTAPLLFIFGESVPKNVFRRLAESLTYGLVWFLRASAVAFNLCGLAPAVQAFCALLVRLFRRGRPGTRGAGLVNVASLLAEGQASGAMTIFQSNMADRVMGIRERRLADVMIPLRKVISVGQDVTRAELMERIAAHNFSRLPVTDPSGQMVGLLDICDVLLAAPPQQPNELVRPMPSMTARMTVPDAIYHLQRQHAVMAVVEDDSRRHVGIVTIKDLLEEIVGELE